MRCPTCPPFLTELTSIRFTAHLPTLSAPSGPGHHGSVSGQLPRMATWRSSHIVAVSCRLSPTGIRFLGILFPPAGFRRSYGWPSGRHSGPDLVGFSAFRTCEKRPGWVPSLLRGGGVVPATETSMTGACRFTTASPYPRCNIPSARVGITKHTKIHRVHPSGLPLAHRPRMERGPFGFSPGFAPTVTHDARQGGDDPFDTGPDHTLINEPPIGVTTPHVRLSRRTPSSPRTDPPPSAGEGRARSEDRPNSIRFSTTSSAFTRPSSPSRAASCSPAWRSPPAAAPPAPPAARSPPAPAPANPPGARAHPLPRDAPPAATNHSRHPRTPEITHAPRPACHAPAGEPRAGHRAQDFRLLTS